VRNKPIKGILAPKPPNSDAFNEQYVFDFVGMLGLPQCRLMNRCNGGDFRIVVIGGDLSLAISRVKLVRTR